VARCVAWEWAALAVTKPLVGLLAGARCPRSVAASWARETACSWCFSSGADTDNLLFDAGSLSYIFFQGSSEERMGLDQLSYKIWRYLPGKKRMCARHCCCEGGNAGGAARSCTGLGHMDLTPRDVCMVGHHSPATGFLQDTSSLLNIAELCPPPTLQKFVS